MPLKRFRPITPTLRYKTVSDFAELTQGNEPVRKLTTEPAQARAAATTRATPRRATRAAGTAVATG